jgi:dienelactone hydrolase
VEPTETAMSVVTLAQAGDFGAIQEMFAETLRPLVAAESLRAAWTGQVERLGPLTTIGTAVTERAGGGVHVVRVPLTFDRGALTLVLSLIEGSGLNGLNLQPVENGVPGAGWQPPSSIDPDSFTETDVTVGTGPLTVPGTLSLPRRGAPHTAVLLLAGSGPQDRDESIGGNKPFKDIAWGLAQRGIAVLRFDKVTFAHRQALADLTGFTLADEYVPAALAGIRLLREHPAIDPARVFVLGHSLGGTIAPRVALADPAVAGLILLAGGAQPLHWAAVRQARYIAALDPATAPAAQPVIDSLIGQAEAVERATAETLASDLPFGVPAAYWMDVRDYDQVATAAAVARPILIMQGGRDYQVTIDDDLARWKAGLAHRPDVTIRVYDADNHLFFPGRGPSTPKEYEPAQHVDPAVITDLAAWLTKPATA